MTLFDTAPATRVIEFRISHAPVPQPRQRHRIFWPKNAKYMRGFELMQKAHVVNYTPADAEVEKFKSAARWAARNAYEGTPLACPFIMDAVYVFPRHRNKCWKTRPMPRYPHVELGDRDNLDKALMDALTGIIWVDDKQVFAGRSEKWRASGTEQPHVEVRITAVEESC